MFAARSRLALAAARRFSTAPHVYTLPELPYAYSALEPVISGEIMQIHHAKHHQAYVTNLNAALVQYAEAEKKHDLEKMVALQAAIKFNGGGHVNHSFFWKNLASPKEGGGAPPTVRSLWC
jgi:Fe-Mn family superoxide dismutase